MARRFIIFSSAFCKEERKMIVSNEKIDSNEMAPPNAAVPPKKVVRANYQCNGVTLSGARCKTMKKVSSPHDAYCKRHAEPSLQSSPPSRDYSSMPVQPLTSPTVYYGDASCWSSNSGNSSNSSNSSNSILENHLIDLCRMCNATPDLILHLQRHYMNMRDGAASLIGTIRMDQDDDVGSSASNHSSDARKLVVPQSTRSGYVIQIFKFVFTVIMAILFVKVVANSNLSMISRFADAITDAITKSSETSTKLIVRATRVTQALVEPYTSDELGQVSVPFF
jgi:hypothetical protein